MCTHRAPVPAMGGPKSAEESRGCCLSMRGLLQDQEGRRWAWAASPGHHVLSRNSEVSAVLNSHLASRALERSVYQGWRIEPSSLNTLAAGRHDVWASIYTLVLGPTSVGGYGCWAPTTQGVSRCSNKQCGEGMKRVALGLEAWVQIPLCHLLASDLGQAALVSPSGAWEVMVL